MQTQHDSDLQTDEFDQAIREDANIAMQLFAAAKANEYNDPETSQNQQNEATELMRVALERIKAFNVSQGLDEYHRTEYNEEKDEEEEELQDSSQSQEVINIFDAPTGAQYDNAEARANQQFFKMKERRDLDDLLQEIGDFEDAEAAEARQLTSAANTHVVGTTTHTIPGGAGAGPGPNTINLTEDWNWDTTLWGSKRNYKKANRLYHKEVPNQKRAHVKRLRETYSAQRRKRIIAQLELDVVKLIESQHEHDMSVPEHDEAEMNERVTHYNDYWDNWNNPKRK